ncbi:MAG: DUF4148 domain-containing protein [Rubrivivax sp.]|nr:DUF4148 domain-containing protein [Rubrivivax sp.]
MTTKLTTLTALVAIAAAFASPAFAQEATADNFAAVQSFASRDAVRSDAIAALRSGTLERGEASIERTVFVSVNSRAQVAAEAAEALRLGLIGQGEGPAPVLTPAQAEMIRMAGQQAATMTLAAR